MKLERPHFIGKLYSQEYFYGILCVHQAASFMWILRQILHLFYPNFVKLSVLHNDLSSIFVLLLWNHPRLVQRRYFSHVKPWSDRYSLEHENRIHPPRILECFKLTMCVEANWIIINVNMKQSVEFFSIF